MFDVAEKYKGKWVRLYTQATSYTEGVFLGVWNQYYVTLQSDVGRHARVTFTKQEEVHMLIPVQLLDREGKIYKHLYANVN